MLHKQIHKQSSQSAINNLSFIGIIIVGGTSSNSCLNMNDTREIKENLELKTSSTRSNKKEIFSLSEVISNKRTLENIKILEKGWNGYNADPIDHSIIESVSNLIVGLERQPKIFPTGRGTVQIEYSNLNDYLEIEISNATNSFFEQKKDKEFQGDISIDKINEKVNEFFT